MRAEILPAEGYETIRRAVALLRAGGLVAFPTDTVYGLGALAFDGVAVESIYIAKDRPIEKAIPILIGDADDLPQLTSHIPEIARALAERFWPGPLTLILPKKQTLPESVSATNTVAVRIPNHDVARALLRAAGPMAVTSANVSGGSNPNSADEVFAQLGERIPLIVDGGKTRGGIPSTLVDCLGEKPIILRAGPVSMEDILRALK